MYIQKFKRLEQAKDACKEIDRTIKSQDCTTVEEIGELCSQIRGLKLGWKRNAPTPVIMSTYEGYEVMLEEPVYLVQVDEDLLSEGTHIRAYDVPKKVRLK